jgi:hypothetical protein
MSRARELADLSNVINKGANLQPNLITNGDMSVDQRNSGSSVTATHGSDTFCPDRYRFIENHSGSFSLQQVEDAPDNLEYSMKVTVTGTDTSLSATEFTRNIQPIEGQHISHLNWGSANARTCTLTFYVKSSVTGAYYISLFNSAANRSFVSSYTINTADTWEKKTITITGDTSGTWLTTNGAGIYISWSLGTGTTYQTSTLNSWAGAFAMAGSDQINLAATNSATWQLTGVSFVVGDSAPVTHPYESFAENLKRCQRYFVKSWSQGSAVTTNNGIITASCVGNVNRAFGNVYWPTTMRTSPTVTWYNGSSGTVNKWRNGSQGVDITPPSPNTAIGESGYGFVLSSGITAVTDTLQGHYQAEAEL